MAMAMGGSDARRPAPVMNVTPLVDITLVVLIIFMIVTPMMTKTFWLNIPKEDDQSPPPPTVDQPLVMTVAADGTLRVNSRVLTPDELRVRLPRMLAAQRQPVLYVDAADSADYGRVVAAMDAARQGGARSIAMLTTKIVK
jgi:biopolymer transport protein TolR